MSIDMPAAVASEAADAATQPPSRKAAWLETALTVAFTVVAVLFVSFLAVVTGLV